MIRKDEALKQKQYDLEQNMKQEGRERYLGRAGSMKSASMQNEPHKLISKAIEKVASELKVTVSDAMTQSTGRPPEWLDHIKDLDPDTLAYLGLNLCFDSILSLASRTTTIVQIGRRVEIENWAVALKDYDKDLFKRIEKQVTKDHTAQRYRIKAAKIIASREGFSREKWSNTTAVKVGSVVFNAVIKASDLFEVRDVSEVVGDTKLVICLTKEAREELTELQEDASWASPMFGPMIIPPRPWESFSTGCYYDPALSAAVRLVRGAGREQRQAIEHQFKSGTPDYVVALNALQATPLKINRQVVEVVRWCSEEKKLFGKYPQLVAPPFPQKPENYDELEPEAQSLIRREQKNWHSKMRMIDADRENMRVALKTADDMSEYDEFYLPWNFDTRGRMYPVPAFNYHRDDHIKAMFLFARGKKVTAETVGWLKIHLANCGDFGKISKRSLDERITWVDEHHDQIMQCATDWRSVVDFWTQADKPFQFLAACFEYARMIKEGENFVCYLPPAMDGTNSGVQHYAAANRSEADGALVNLVPSDTCADVYEAVAKVSRELLEKDGSPEALKWLEYGVTRSTVKRNVMTYGYSSVERGFTDQIMEDLMRPLMREVALGMLKEHPFGAPTEHLRHAKVLAKANYAAVQQVISSVSQAMSYLQAMSKAVSDENKTLRWTTPSGFPAVQAYKKYTKKKVRLFLWDRQAKKMERTQFTTREQIPDKIDSRKMKAAVAANFVHSLDSAHMQNTILMALDNGIEDFFMIHDSFGTHVADTWIMYDCIRAAFVDQYVNGCVFQDLETLTRQKLSNPAEELPAIPEKGDLDITSIMESVYCFS